MALESGHLGAAILDVTREEPLPADDPLWSAPNVYISPHCSAAEDRYTETLLALFADNLERYTHGLGCGTSSTAPWDTERQILRGG